MGNQAEIFGQLEEDIKRFIKKYPQTAHLLYDSFVDHKNRYKKDLEIFQQNFKGGTVLDLGANPFHLMYCLKKLGINVAGVDINPDNLKKFISQFGLLVVKCDIEKEKLPFSNNSFDFIILNEVFEHLREKPIFVLTEIHRVLKKGGILLLTTPNLYALHKILMFNLGMSINDAYQEFNKLNLYGYIGHIREYSTKEIKKFLENTGFQIKKVIYQNHYSFFKYPGFKNNFILRLAGLMIDLVMILVPFWRRHQIFIAKKI